MQAPGFYLGYRSMGLVLGDDPSGRVVVRGVDAVRQPSSFHLPPLHPLLPLCGQLARGRGVGCGDTLLAVDGVRVDSAAMAQRLLGVAPRGAAVRLWVEARDPCPEEADGRAGPKRASWWPWAAKRARRVFCQ